MSKKPSSIISRTLKESNSNSNIFTSFHNKLDNEKISIEAS